MSKARTKALKKPGTLFLDENGVLRRVEVYGETPWVYPHLNECYTDQGRQILQQFTGFPAEVFDHDRTRILRVLQLNLIRYWFDLIAEGRKDEEYREITPFWKPRMMARKESRHTDPVYSEKYVRSTEVFREYDLVRFLNSMRPDSNELILMCNGIRKDNPKPGMAPEDAMGKQFYVVSLGARCEVGKKLPEVLK